ncbi:MAG: copR [Sporomusa sp.]|jgi:DNA-binding response OmpR family regulator|nr:copR [Sporomusa sp.]
MRILMAEDDPFTGEMLVMQLSKAGWDVEWAKDGHEAITMCSNNKYDLLLLDWILPGCNGIEICSLLRRQRNYVPIIMLTSRSTVEDCVTGLNCGADDYISKPCIFPELLARIQNLIRRSHSIDEAIVTKSGTIEYRCGERTIVARGQLIHLSKKEAALFEILLRCKGQPVSREHLAVAIWKEKPVSLAAVDPLVAQLRRRLEPFRFCCSIENERGSGFVLRWED